MSIDSILELESVIQNKVEMDVKSLRTSERTTEIENDNKFKDYQSTVKAEDGTHALMTFMLEKQMILTVSPFEGELRVDIKYLNEELSRTRKGLSLSIPQFKMLAENIKLFDETFKKIRDDLLPEGEEIDKSIHLGGERWMYIKSPFETVQIRHKYYLDGEDQPRVDRHQRVSLKCFTWKEFVKACRTILTSGILSNLRFNSGAE